MQRGIRELEEILSRLDDRVKNAQWLKEHAPADAPERIKEAIKESFPGPKPEPKAEPKPEPAPEPAPKAEQPPAPAPQLAPALPPIEIPPLIAPAPEPVKPWSEPPQVKMAMPVPAPAIPEPLPPVPEPLPAQEPEPILSTPEPAPVPEPALPEPLPPLQELQPAPEPEPEPEPEPAAEMAPEVEPATEPAQEPAPEPAPEPVPEPEPEPQPEPLPQPPALPEIKDLPAFLQPKVEPRPLPQPDAAPLPAPAPGPLAAPAPAPAAKPARKPFAISRTALILFFTTLAVAGGAYQLFLNSAAQRYAAAGQLAASARNAEAVSAYTRIINMYPRSLEAAYSQYAIGEIKALQGDIPAAIEHYEDYMVAAPDKDPKLASSRFKVAELHLKEDRLDDAEYLYQNPVVRESDWAARAAARVGEIGAFKTRLAEAKKLAAKSPDKSVEAYTALAAEHPKYAPAQTGLEEARKALAEANSRPALKRAPAPKPVKPAPVKTTAKPAPPKPQAQKPPAPAAEPAPARAPAPAPATTVSKAQYEMCSAIWQTEAAQGQLNADMMFTKVKHGCDDLKQKLDACKEARDEVMGLQGVPPEARVQMQQEIDPEWTLAKQLEEDTRIRKNYEDRRCAALFKSIPD